MGGEGGVGGGGWEWVGVSGGESGASFAAAGVEDGASVPRRHSRAKTVSALAANVGGLVSAFHCRNRRGMNVWNSAGKRNYTQFPPQLTTFSRIFNPPRSPVVPKLCLGMRHAKLCLANPLPPFRARIFSANHSAARAVSSKPGASHLSHPSQPSPPLQTRANPRASKSA